MKNHVIPFHFKQIFAVLLCPVILVLNFCGCQKELPQETASVSSNPASSCDNSLYAPLYGNNEGMYCSNYIHQNNCWQLSYIDYSSCVEMPLCASPNCTHSSESCTAWMPPHSAASSPCILKNDQIVFCLQQSDPERSALYIADKDGSNRRALISDQPGWGDFFPFFSDAPYLADDTFLYFILLQHGLDVDTSLALYRVPLVGGEMEFLFPLDSDISYLGTWGRELILSRSHYDEPEHPEISDKLSFEEQQRIQQDYFEKWKQEAVAHTQVLFKNIDTGEETPFISWDEPAGTEPAFCWSNDQLWWCSSSCPETLHWLNPSGEEGCLELHWPTDSIDLKDWSVSPVRWIDNHLIVTLHNFSSEPHQFALDLSNGSATELTLSFVTMGRTIPIKILAALPDRLFVKIREIEGQIAEFDKTGLPYIQETSIPSLGFISYEDYFSNTPNYQEIKMLYEN